MEDESKQAFHQSSSNVTIDDTNALELMTILFKRGYFHDNVNPLRHDTIQFRHSHDDNDNHDPNVSCSYLKEDASLVETTNNAFIMIDTLRDRFIDLLDVRGRISMVEANKILHVSTDIILRRIVPWMIDSDKNYIVVTGPNKQVTELLLESYFHDQTKALLNELRENPKTGCILISDAAKNVYNLPIDITLIQLEKYITSMTADTLDAQILITDNASKVLVISEHIDMIRKDLCNVLCDKYTNEPIEIKTVAKLNGWEVNWVLRMIKEGELDVNGEFHGDIYVPNEFVNNKRTLVASSFVTNGYVTSHMCRTMFGISPSQMKEYIIQNNTLAEELYIVLTNSIISKNLILVPLLESVRDASESNSWLDLQLHIPIELLEYETKDAQYIIDTYLLVEVLGAAYIDSDGGLYFSQTMIDTIANTHLPLTIKKYAVSRAKEVYSSHKNVDNISHADANETTIVPQSGKEKRSNRKSLKTSSFENGIDHMVRECGGFPLSIILEAVFEAYPELSNADISPKILNEMCKASLYTETLGSMWSSTIFNEILRLDNTKSTCKSLDHTTEDTNMHLFGFETIESAFEDPGCFANCCYMIQAKAKFLLYAFESKHEFMNNTVREELQRDFFAGCCRDFAFRVTKYALYRNRLEDGIFSFYVKGDALPYSYFSPIDLAATSYDPIYFSCVSSRNDTLVVLKEELPRNIGIQLSTTWELCGLESYQHGAIASSSSVNTPSNIEDFLSHARENCFTFCGLPFANYDKKAEKKFLSLRRLQLISRLEKAEDISTLFDVTIMILYQTIKNLVVSGPLLQGPILEMLLKERKVTDSMAFELRLIASMTKQGAEIDSTTMERVQNLLALKK